MKKANNATITGFAHSGRWVDEFLFGGATEKSSFGSGNRNKSAIIDNVIVMVDIYSWGMEYINIGR